MAGSYAYLPPKADDLAATKPPSGTADAHPGQAAATEARQAVRPSRVPAAPGKYGADEPVPRSWPERMHLLDEQLQPPDLSWPAAMEPGPLLIFGDRAVDEAVSRLLTAQMADVYERSFARNPKGRAGPGNKDLTRIKPEARAPAGEAALPQLVAHGFANLPARLVSVLRGPDGGDLQWLGTSVHTRDFMHFELKKRPARY